MNEFFRLYILVLPDVQKFENIFTIIVSKLNIKTVCLIFSLMEKNINSFITYTRKPLLNELPTFTK